MHWLFDITLTATAALFVYSIACVYRARKFMEKARQNYLWQRMPVDQEIATVALALEAELFTSSDQFRGGAGLHAERLRRVLHWCQTPLKRMPVGKIAGID